MDVPKRVSNKRTCQVTTPKNLNGEAQPHKLSPVQFRSILSDCEPPDKTHNTNMASQLLPLGMSMPSLLPSSPLLTDDAELIDKCVGSRIWVVMKGDKGTVSTRERGLYGGDVANDRL